MSASDFTCEHRLDPGTHASTYHATYSLTGGEHTPVQVLSYGARKNRPENRA